MPNAKDLKPLENIKALWIGRSGSWKSTCLSSFPKPLYIFDMDGRIQALRGKDIDFDQFEPETAFDKLEKKLDEFLVLGKNGKFPYKTIGFDSLSTCQELLVENALRITEKMPQNKEEGLKGRWIGKVQMADKGHYGYRAKVLQQIVYDYLKVFQCNIIVTGHVVDNYNVDGTICGKKIMGGDKIAERFPINFDETWEFYTEESAISQTVKHFIRFRGTLAKTTFRNLPDFVEITDSDNFYEKFVSAVLKTS